MTLNNVKNRLTIISGHSINDVKECPEMYDVK